MTPLSNIDTKAHNQILFIIRMLLYSDDGPDNDSDNKNACKYKGDIPMRCKTVMQDVFVHNVAKEHSDQKAQNGNQGCNNNSF